MNNYHIYEEIGRGKFSVVYKGRKKKTIEYVAVKSLEKSRRKKVLNEVKIFHNLSHQNILKFYNWYETRNHLWIIFEYCSGGDLLQLLEQDKTLTENVVRLFGKELVMGLYYLHSHGVIYCDLKPSNVLLNEYGSLKLCDFGLAKKIVDLIQPDANAEGSASKKGTPYYMAPELFQDEGVYSFASDLWALGCVLYELATGHPPFVTSSFTELVNLIVNAETPKVEKFSQNFNDLLAGLLEKDPSRRITWDKLRVHPFWSPFEIPYLQIPQQPHYENYLKSRGISISQNPQQQQQQTKEKEEIISTPNTSNISGKALNTSTIASNTSSSNNLTKKTASGTTSVNTQEQVNQMQQQKSMPSINSTNINGGSDLTKKNVNVTRLSQNVIKNIIRESLQLGYDTNQEKDITNNNDLKLINQDQELDFGEGNDEEYEDDNNTNEQQQQQQSNTNDESTSINVEEENSDNANNNTNLITKIDFKAQNKKTNDDNAMTNNINSNKPANNTKSNHRNIKPEIDEVTTTPKNGRSNSTLIDDDKLQTNTLTHQRSNTISGATKTRLTPYDQLLHHASDTSVKPISGNKEIEKPQDCTFSPESLAFECLNPEDVINGIDTPQIENHLADIYNYLASGNSMSDKMNALNYFETLIQNSNVANRLINSAFMNLLLRLLKTTKHTATKAKLCSIVGLLIRYATVIENELSQLGIPTILADVLKDRNEKIKRKAIAALGEYLFYGATQMDEDASNNIWELPALSIMLLAKILKANEDEIVKFYACKTIENISSQSINAGIKFATIEFISVMHLVYTTTKIENMKVCASICLCNIGRLNSSLLPSIVEKITLNNFIQALADSNPRIQQSFITILNLFLHSMSSKAQQMLTEEKSLLTVLISLLEHPSIVIRGKALLTFCLLFKLNLKWLMVLNENKFIIILDRSARDNYKYVQSCLSNLIEIIIELIPAVLKNILDELNKLKQQNEISNTNNNNTSGIVESNSNKDLYKTSLGSLPMILNVMNSQLLKSRVITQSFLITIFNIFDASESCKKAKIGDYKTIIFMIFESFSSNTKLLIANYEIVLQILLPSLLSKLTSENTDTRFNSLKIFTDILIQYLNDESIYDPVSSKSNTTTNLINDIISNQLLPKTNAILNDQDPLPLHGLKLMNIITEKNLNFISKMKSRRILPLFLDYFNYNHPRLTSNTLRIIVNIVKCKDVTLEELQRMNFITRATTILKYFYSNQQEWCYEELLDIFLNLFTKMLDGLKTLKIQINTLENLNTPTFITDPTALAFIKQYEQIIDIEDILISLSGHVENIIADNSVNCLLNMIYIFGALKKKEMALKPDQIAYLINILPQANKINISKKLSKVLYWIAAMQDCKLSVPNDKKSFMINILEKMKMIDDRSVSAFCREIQKCLIQLKNMQWVCIGPACLISSYLA